MLMLWIWGLCIMCKLRRSGVWVFGSMASTPKNSGLRLCFAPLLQTNKMHLCVSEESCLMLCILFSRLGVSPHNLTTLLIFLGCFLLRLFVVLQWCLVFICVYKIRLLCHLQNYTPEKSLLWWRNIFLISHKFLYSRNTKASVSPPTRTNSREWSLWQHSLWSIQTS